MLLCSKNEEAYRNKTFNVYSSFKETKSATMNIFRKKKYFLLKSFVKAELS